MPSKRKELQNKVSSAEGNSVCQEIIKVENLVKYYKTESTELIAVNNVSFAISQGEFLSITGASGSGKSTLMNILGCLDSFDDGSYYLNGTSVADLKEWQLARIRSRMIGFVFQGFNLIQQMTALENVELPLIYQRLPRKERRSVALESLEKVGLIDRIKHKPSELSGGQQQRVAIARALAVKPALLLADEPTGNLDSKTGSEIIEYFHSLHSAGNTIVMVTHDSKIAEQGQRKIVMADGCASEGII